MLDLVDQSLNSDRTDILRNLKGPLFDSVQLLETRFRENKYLVKSSEQIRTLLISIFNDLCQTQIMLSHEISE